MACVLFARLGARAACRRGGGAASWATRGVTCGSAPVDAGSHRRTRGTAESSRGASHDHRSPKGRRAAAVSYTHLTLPTICSV
eukprot:66986-Alexandrium_andersonii.AAC.1